MKHEYSMSIGIDILVDENGDWFFLDKNQNKLWGPYRTKNTMQVAIKELMVFWVEARMKNVRAPKA